MNQIRYLFLVFSLLTLKTQAQSVPKIKVIETQASFSQGSQSAFMVEVYAHKKDDVEHSLKEFLKDRNAKVSLKKEIFGDNALFKEFGENTVDVYALIEKKTETSQNLIIGIDLGGVFLSKKEHEKQAKDFEKILYEFAVKISKETVLKEVKEAEKVLSKQEKELEGLKSDKADLEKDIENYNQKIEHAKKEIEKNIQNQGASEKKIVDQKNAVQLLQAKEKAVD